MSRLREIVENHEHLDDLCAVLKHYGVNAEFVTAAVVEALNKGSEEGEEQEQEPNADLTADLKQLFSTY